MSEKIERAIDDFGDCCWRERIACDDGAPTSYPLAQRASEQARAALLAAIAEAVAEERAECAVIVEDEKYATCWRHPAGECDRHLLGPTMKPYTCGDLDRAAAAIRQRGERGGGEGR